MGKTEGLCDLEEAEPPPPPPHADSVSSVTVLELLPLCWLTGLVSKAALTQER